MSPRLPLLPRTQGLHAHCQASVAPALPREVLRPAGSLADRWAGTQTNSTSFPAVATVPRADFQGSKRRHHRERKGRPSKLMLLVRDMTSVFSLFFGQSLGTAAHGAHRLGTRSQGYAVSHMEWLLESSFPPQIFLVLSPQGSKRFGNFLG